MKPPNNVDLHRLIWSPDDIENGEVLTSAFPRNDLLGEERYLSVDRTDLLNSGAAEEVVKEIQSKADGKNFIRDEAYSALLCCRAVRSIEDEDGVKPFEVREEPLDSNAAHCGIRNVSGKKGRSYVNQLRVRLVSAIHTTLKFSEFATTNS